MAILWCGGEDVDFPTNPAAYSVTTTAGTFRSGYARCALKHPFTGVAAGTTFAGGAITSGWFSCHFVTDAGINTIEINFGFGTSGGNGVFIGTGTSTSTKLTLYSYSGGTMTALAAETGASIAAGTANRIDISFSGVGGSATINVYLNGSSTALITYTGTVPMSSVNCCMIGGGGNDSWAMSEFIVASSDTRSMSLVTMAPNALGTTDAWTGAYTDANPTTINDANSVNTNTTAQDEQFNLIDLPSGTFSILAVKVVARSMATAGATATGIKLGVNSGGTVAVGSTTTLGTSFQPVESLLLTNPVTTNAWQQSEMNPLQINLRSA